MPKQYYQISKFIYGIMGKPQDERDIPDDAASDSLNIESLTQGELMGIPDDKFLKKSGFDSDVSSIYYAQGGSSTGTYGGVASGSKPINPED